MKTLFLSGAILTGLMLASTVMCGLWLRAHQPVDPSSMLFHLAIALASTVLAIVTLGVGAALAMRAG